MTIAAVVGLGTMGAGIAAVMARGGLTVRACDVKPEAVERARGELPAIAALLDRLGLPAKGDATAVAFHDSLEACVEGADLVLENVPERLDLKQQVFRQLDALVGPGCLLASDTSGIPITKLQDVVSHPERVAGMHWSNPPHLIPMIEVVSGARTAPETRDRLVALIRELGLLPVVVKKDVPGFVENRVLYAIMREALELVEEGVIEPEDLDTCVSWGIGYKLAIVGPMALLDMAGLDIYQSVASYLNPELSRRQDVPAVIAERTAQGRLGLKTGGGLFDYTPEELQSLRARRAQRFVAVRKALEAD